MTEEEGDKLHELSEAIWVAVHAVVDSMTKGLNEEMDTELRQSLTEEFRFWRSFSPSSGEEEKK